MSQFNPELIKALAHGDEEAYESIKNLPIPVRMSIGLEVDKLRESENIVPMGNGLSIYEKKPSSFYSDEEVGRIIADRLQKEKDAEKLKEQIREEHLKKVVEQQMARSRAGLMRNDR